MGLRRRARLGLPKHHVDKNAGQWFSFRAALSLQDVTGAGGVCLDRAVRPCARCSDAFGDATAPLSRVAIAKNWNISYAAQPPRST